MIAFVGSNSQNSYFQLSGLPESKPEIVTNYKKPSFAVRFSGVINTSPRDLTYIGLRSTILRFKPVRNAFAHLWDKLPNKTNFNLRKVLVVEEGKMLRGPSPGIKGMGELAKYRDKEGKKIGAIVNFQILFEKQKKKLEKEAKKYGIKFINIPVNSFDPRQDQLKKFYKTIKRHENELIYSCCRHGTDRTGRVMADYKVYKGLAIPEEARKEWREYGYRETLFPELMQAFDESVATFSRAALAYDA